MDPITLVMLALLGFLIFLMFRNSKKRKEMQEQLRAGLQPGVEVMLNSGIYGRILAVDEEANRATLLSGEAALEVHLQAITQIVPSAEPESADSVESLDVEGNSENAEAENNSASSDEQTGESK